MTYNTIQELFTGICDSIREKTGETGIINHQDIPAKISAINSGEDMKAGTFYCTSFCKGIETETLTGSINHYRHILTNVDSSYDWVYVQIPFATVIFDSDTYIFNSFSGGTTLGTTSNLIYDGSWSYDEDGYTDEAGLHGTCSITYGMDNTVTIDLYLHSDFGVFDQISILILGKGSMPGMDYDTNEGSSRVGYF